MVVWKACLPMLKVFETSCAMRAEERCACTVISDTPGDIRALEEDSCFDRCRWIPRRLHGFFFMFSQGLISGLRLGGFRFSSRQGAKEQFGEP